MRIKLKDSHIYEIAKVGGIFLYAFIGILAWAINPMEEREIRMVLISYFASSVAAYLSISLLYLFFSLQFKRNIFSKKVFSILLIPSCYISAFLWFTILQNLSRLLLSKSLFLNSFFFIKSFGYIYIIIAFAGLYYLVNHWINLKKQKEMTLQATNLANEAQLQMLRYQINPHFLFNALNTIRSMVEEDKTVARNMITELSSFFRYSLTQDGNTDTLENEINAIKNYLEIQKIRFEEKLNIEYDIDEELYHLKIPFYIILPLVENAIKFGLQSSPSHLSIKIVAKANSKLEIGVYNSGHIVKCEKSNEGTKTGIKNTKKRLSLFFPDNYSFELSEEDGWVISKIIINDYKKLIAE